MSGRRAAFAGFGCAGLTVAFVIAIAVGSRVAVTPAPPPEHVPPVAAPAPPPALPPVVPTDDEPREWLYVSGPVDVRAEPDRDAPVVHTLRRGSRVQLGPPDAGGWSRLYARDAPDGYVYRASALLRTDASTERGEEPLIYHRGPRGGCYYVEEPSGERRYVDHSRCG
jgi:hypothetical protein